MSGTPSLLLTTTALLVLAASAASAQPPGRIYRLPIGDAPLRDRDAPLVLDGITDTAAGEVITPADLPGRLRGTRLLLLGESHTSVESHRVQLRVIEQLLAAGRRVLIGLEMFPYTEQQSLDHWSEGLLTEEGFVKLSRWYEHWGYHWRYYRDIFVFARDHDIPLVAVNTPRDVVAAVRKKGLANLTPEEAAHLPPSGVDVDSADHLTFFKASFEEGEQVHGGMSEDAWKSMLSAQATWDASMAWNAVQALERTNDPEAIMVVLVGSGHVSYGVGIARQARRWFKDGIATLVGVPVAFPEEGVTIDSIRASLASFVWGVPPDPEPSYPTLGITTRADADGRRVVIEVAKDSPAQRAGFQAGDVLMSMDGQDLADREILNSLMAAKHWGDAATVVVRRGNADATLTAYFRRTQKVTPPPAAPPGPAAGGRP